MKMVWNVDEKLIFYVSKVIGVMREELMRSDWVMTPAAPSLSLHDCHHHGLRRRLCRRGRMSSHLHSKNYCTAVCGSLTRHWSAGSVCPSRCSGTRWLTPSSSSGGGIHKSVSAPCQLLSTPHDSHPRELSSMSKKTPLTDWSMQWSHSIIHRRSHSPSRPS